VADSIGGIVSSLTSNEVSDFFKLVVSILTRCVSFVERKNMARKFEIMDTNTRQ